MSGIQQFLLPANNIWTGTNTWRDHLEYFNSTNNATFYPDVRWTFTGYTPQGAVSMGHEASGTDNPDSLHSSIGYGINFDRFTGGSIDGSGIWVYHQQEFKYQGVAVATITSISVVAGVGTFTVNSTASLYKAEGIAVRGNSTSSYNTYWIIQAISDGTHFTAIFKSGTAPTSSGTGGDVRAEGNEENANFSGYRWMAVACRNGNPSKDGEVAFSYHTTISPPSDFACAGGIGTATLALVGNESTSGSAGGTNLSIWNQNTSNKNSSLTLYNDAAGKNNFAITMSPVQNTADDVRITQGGGNPITLKGARVILGANESSDDGSNQLQVFGNTKLNNNFVLSGTSASLSVVDSTSSSYGVRSAATTGPGVISRRTSVNNSTGGTKALTLEVSPTASPTSYAEFLGFGVNLVAGSPNEAHIITPSGVTEIAFDINGSGKVFEFTTSDFFAPSIYTTNGHIKTDQTVLTMEKPITVSGTGGISTGTIGGTLNVKSGTNAKAGTFTLVAGAATVANTSVTANSVIVVTLKTNGGTRAGNPDIVPTASTGFTATGAATDTSTYNFIILEVA